jgi:hypothetical protein
MAHVSRLALLLGALLAAGCSRRTVAGSVPAPSSPPVPAPSGELVVLIGHDDAESTVRYLPVRIAAAPDGSPAPLPPRQRPALRHPEASVRAASGDWVPAYDAVAAQQQARWVHAASAGDSYELRVEELDETAAPARSIALGPVRPTALAVADGYVLVGSAGALGYVKLDEAEPRYRQLVSHPGRRAKPYDFFVRSAERVLAVDDEVEPRFADWLELSPAGVRFRETVELPGVINGRYQAGVLERAGVDSFTLHAVVPFGIVSGHGQLLASLALSPQGSTPGASSTLNGSHGDSEEFVSRAHPTDRPALWLGSELSSWTGIALLSGERRLLLAAGTRGLWSVALPLPATGKPSVSRAAGLTNCSDVTVRGTLVLALEQRPDGASELRVLRWTGSELALEHERRLDGAFQRFVQ